jgi:2-C-methyl-D-erythritol 4-phosphate cytidylyltransferase
MSQHREPDERKLAIVVAAAGESRRFGSDKLAARLGGITVLERTVAALRTALPAAPMVVVVAADRLDAWRTVLTAAHPDVELCAGGPRRQDSVRLGIKHLAAGRPERIAVHDAARPLVQPDDVRSVVAASEDVDVALLCAEVFDTVKRVDDRGRVVETVDRRPLRLAQTPQVVRTGAFERAWRRQDPAREWTDEAMLVEADGGEVRCVVGRHPNPKLNTPGDLEWLRAAAGGGP